MTARLQPPGTTIDVWFDEDYERARVRGHDALAACSLIVLDAGDDARSFVDGELCVLLALTRSGQRDGLFMLLDAAEARALAGDLLRAAGVQ